MLLLVKSVATRATTLPPRSAAPMTGDFFVPRPRFDVSMIQRAFEESVARFDRRLGIYMV